MQGFLNNSLGPSTASWLTWTLYGPRAAGTGFSIAGEGYLNFGIIGAFLHMVLLGIILRRLYLMFASNISASRTIMFVASIGIFVVNVRGDTNLMFAPLVNIFVLCWLLKVICGEQEVVPLQEINEDNINYYE